MLEINSDIELKDSRLECILVDGDSKRLEIKGRANHDFLINTAASMLLACSEVDSLYEAIGCYMTLIKARHTELEEAAQYALFTAEDIAFNCAKDNQKEKSEILELKQKIKDQQTTIENLKLLVSSLKGGRDGESDRRNEA